MGELLEYKTLLACKPKLLLAVKLALPALLDDLVAEELITPDLGEVQGLDSSTRARQLVDHIIKLVQLSPAPYERFVEILRSKYGCTGKEIAEILQTTYDELKEQQAGDHEISSSTETQVVAGCQVPARSCAVQTNTNIGKVVCNLEGIPHKKSSHGISNPIVCFKDLDEDNLYNLKAIMKSLTKKIKVDYAIFFDRIYTSFRNSQKIDHRRLTLALRNSECEPLFSDVNIQTVHDVFELLTLHSSYFNYEILETLVQVCGSEQDKRSLEEYSEHFSEYCRTMPCAEEVCGSEEAGPKRTKLIFKLDYEREKLKPDAVKSIKNNIAYCLGIRPSVLYLANIKDGCILLEFLVPTCVIDQLFPLSDVKIIALYTEVRVLHILDHVDIETEANRLLEAQKVVEYHTQVPDPTDSEVSSIKIDEKSFVVDRRLDLSSVIEHPNSSEVSLATQANVEAPITLAAVIEDDRLFVLFRKFLNDECITRNLNFWLACEHYRQLCTENRQHLLTVAQAIYVEFIGNKALQWITIRPETRNEIMCTRLETVTVQLFDTAQQEIWEEMERNELQQFAFSHGFPVVKSTYMPNRTYSNMKQSENTTIDKDRPMGEELEKCVTQSLRDDKGLLRPEPPVQPRKRQPKIHLFKEATVSNEEFVALVNDRLLKICDNREVMKQRVRDKARTMGKAEHEIMLLEWYDHPGAWKYVLSQEPDLSGNCSSASSVDSLETNQPQPQLLNGLAQQQVNSALKDLEIINKVNKNHHRTYDSGLGATNTSSEVDSDQMSICSKSDLVSQSSHHNESRISSWTANLPDQFIHEKGNGEYFHHPLPLQNTRHLQHYHTTWHQTYRSSQSFTSHKQRHISSSKDSQNCQQKQQLYQNRSGRDTRYVVYYLNDIPTPFAQRIKVRNFTLGDFKTKVFLRNGEYRFFFKSYDEERKSEVEKEYFDDSAILPLVRGSIIGRVKKLSTTLSVTLAH